jgi:hypothetical protein
LVAVEGRRWAIEGAVETAKTELGLRPQRDPVDSAAVDGTVGTGLSRR